MLLFILLLNNWRWSIVSKWHFMCTVSVQKTTWTVHQPTDSLITLAQKGMSWNTRCSRHNPEAALYLPSAGAGSPFWFHLCLHRFWGLTYIMVVFHWPQALSILAVSLESLQRYYLLCADWYPDAKSFTNIYARSIWAGWGVGLAEMVKN